jgi:RNA polymerase sigma-70 factor, ECF subfamily
MPSTDHVERVDHILFEQDRQRWVSLGFRILHSVPDSEDVVQEAWLRWHHSQRSDLANPEAFLTTVVTRLSLDRLRRVRARRETPLQEYRAADAGQDDPQATVQRAAAVAEALLLLLQRLSPPERGAVLLRDVLQLPYAEAAGQLGRAEPAVRQLVSRGRRRLRQPAERYAVDEVTHTRVVRCFRTVCSGGDISPLLQALTPPATASSNSRSGVSCRDATTAILS